MAKDDIDRLVRSKTKSRKSGKASQPEASLALRLADPAASTPNTTEGTREMLATLLEHPQPNDVRFFFPRSSSELWASSTLLASTSPYFRDLFSSEFGEGATDGVDGQAKQRSTTAVDGPLSEPGNDDLDSDGEWDSRHPPPKVPDKEATPSKFHEVIVREAAHGTYRAVLLWIYTGSITFRGLRSSPSVPSPPFAVSPKAVFKLADFLDIPSLKSLALKSVINMITVDNAAGELYGELSTLHQEVQNPILDFVVDNWKAVQDSTGMKRVEQRMERDEVPMGGAISLRLAKRLTITKSSGSWRSRSYGETADDMIEGLSGERW